MIGFPSLPNFCVSYKDTCSMSMRVNELLNADRSWNSEALRYIGTDQEIEAIRAIPIVRRGGCDQMIWNFNKMVDIQ